MYVRDTPEPAELKQKAKNALHQLEDAEGEAAAEASSLAGSVVLNVGKLDDDSGAHTLAVVANEPVADNHLDDLDSNPLGPAGVGIEMTEEVPPSAPPPPCPPRTRSRRQAVMFEPQNQS